MMPYMIGQDPETNEIIVCDARTQVFFLRGPATETSAIRDLVQAANEHVHNSTIMIDLIRRAYIVLHKPHWEQGETDDELSEAINNVMSDMLGNDWAKQ